MIYQNCRKTRNFWLLLGLIAFCSVKANTSTLPPDPDNAALLYYQAFFLRPEPDFIQSEIVGSVRPEQISTVLQGGEFEEYTNIDERIAELEEAIKNRDVEPNEPDPYAEYAEELGVLFPPHPDEEMLLDQLRKCREMIRVVSINQRLIRFLRKSSAHVKIG